MKETRQHRVKSDYGLKDYFEFYKNNGGSLDYKLYKKVLTTFYGRVIDLLVSNEYSFKLPHRMGILTIIKVAPKVEFKNNEVRTNMPINFKATNELWKNDAEAKANKTKIYYENKHSNRYRYTFVYSKSKANYINKILYKLQITRTNKYKLRDYIFEYGELIKTEKIQWK